jgi:hypothetical protein
VAPDPVKLATLPLRLVLRVAEEVIPPVAEVARGTIGLVKGAFGDDGHGNGAGPVADPRSEATADPRSDAALRDEPAGGLAADAAAAAGEDPPSDAPEPLASREPGTAPSADPPSAYVEPPPSEAPASEEPEHVDTEAVVVAESADPETADGIHTDLHVAEPWDGYAGMTAADVIGRLEDASPAEVAVVQLYESTHRARKTVIEAAQRRLASSA